jgi:tetraacyldisaccharide 4'-kinase
MKLIRKILFPLGFIYWMVTFLRNKAYDFGILKSYTFTTKTIGVGNLSVGGTGKTPHVDYIMQLLQPTHKTAILSRGYGRKTKGFIMASESQNAETIGDEPYQLYIKNKNIDVAVCEDRKTGIENLLQHKNYDVLVLDDVYQHRKVKLGFYILLTTYDELFCNDYILPFGNLRESAIGKNRASMVIVTKCPANLPESEQQEIKKRLQVKVSVYFTTIIYDDYVYGKNDKILVEEIIHEPKTILAGIAKPSYFINTLQKNASDKVLVYKDHHYFTEKEIKNLNTLGTENKIITTEKDYARLQYNNINNLYYLPIKIKFLNHETDFKNQLNHYLK